MSVYLEQDIWAPTFRHHRLGAGTLGRKDDWAPEVLAPNHVGSKITHDIGQRIADNLHENYLKFTQAFTLKTVVCFVTLRRQCTSMT